MVLRDLFVDVLRTIWAHKLRTLLTMFGIAWGIVSIVLMVAAGEGLRVGQAKVSETLGKDIMIVFAGRTSTQVGGEREGRKIRWRDTDIAAAQAESPDCGYILPELGQDNVKIHSAYNNAALLVTGSYPEFAYIRSLDVDQGRYYNWNDVHEGRRVAFLGSDAKKQLFGSRSAVGETIYLNDIPYTVIGVMQKKKQDSSYDGWDVNKVFIPFTTMQRDFPAKPPATAHDIDQFLVTPRAVDLHDVCKYQIR